MIEINIAAGNVAIRRTPVALEVCIQHVQFMNRREPSIIPRRVEPWADGSPETIMFGFQGGEPAGVAVRKRDPMKDAQQKWPCLDAREKILIAPRSEIPRDRWRLMLALVLIALAGELAVLWAW
jgi:hypothetical protein